jgi:VWFA-related protein
MKFTAGQIGRRQHSGFALGFCLLLFSVCLVLFALPLQSQQPAPSQENPNISVESKLVNVLATVRDKHGAIVNNLKKDDFMLQEDGKPQTIQYFSQESNLPLTLGLLVDTSMSQRSVLGDERDASYTFLDHALNQDKDRAFLLHFDSQVELLQDLTSSRQKLESAMRLIEPSEDDNSSGNGGPRSHGGRMGGGTLLYDAVYLGSNELMKKQQGRKAMIILSDGVDRGSKESLPDAIESAQRADTLVYSILFTGEEGGNRGGFGGPRIGMGPMGGGGGGGRGGHRYPEESRPDGKKVLEQISKETGGRMFEVSKKLTIDQIYSQIEEDLRNQYSLGYTPAADAGLGFHKIELTTKQKDLTVQARDGYYAEH